MIARKLIVLRAKDISPGGYDVSVCFEALMKEMSSNVGISRKSYGKNFF